MRINDNNTQLNHSKKRLFTPSQSLKYHTNGVMVTNATVVPIVWNHAISPGSGYAKCFSLVQEYLNLLIKTKAFTKYLPGKKGSDPQGKVFAVDESLHFLTPSITKNVISDKEITTELSRWISAKYNKTLVNSTIPSNPKKPLDFLYIILFPPGKTLSSGSCRTYCAFHNSFMYTNKKYAYAAVPWSGDCVKNCTISSYKTNSTKIPGDLSVICGSQLSIIFHELTEMVTDAYSNAYYDANGLENADKCIWKTPAACISSSSNTEYCMQPIWNHEPSNPKNQKSEDVGCTNDF